MAKKSAKNSDAISTERLYSLLMPSGDSPQVIPYNAQPEPEPPAPTPPAGAEKLDELRRKLAGVTQNTPLSEPGGDEIVLVSLTEAMVAERLDAAMEKAGKNSGISTKIRFQLSSVLNASISKSTFRG